MSEAKLTGMHTAQNIIDKGLMIIQEYAWLLDSYVLDYYTESHWEKVPRSWLKTLMGVDLPELARFVDLQSPKTYSRVWPLSLLTLRESVAQLSIPRQVLEHNSSSEIWRHICCNMSATSKQVQETYLNPQLGIEPDMNTAISLKYSCPLEASMPNLTYCQDHANSKQQIPSKQCEPNNGLSSPSYLTHPKLKNLFNKHVNPKKRHEISKIAQITAETAHKSGCCFVLDVGSGRGHLARMLAYGYGLRVCCLEAQTALVHEAARFDIELENTVSKHLKPEEVVQSNRPVHLNLTLSNDTSSQEIIEGLKTVFGKPFDKKLSFGIVGLHPCGDLAAILLRLFVECPHATFINIVGCCFMKLTTEKSTPKWGYPMSSHLLTTQVSYELSYIARELACHALESYCERLQEGKFSDLKVHCYRATLEEIILKNWPYLKHSSIKSVKYSQDMTFSQYCDAALSKLDVKVPPEETTSKKVLQNLLEWKQVVIFFTLRLLLAPLVETVILLDRLLYLREHGISSVLIPVFDPKLSPRNHILLANKR